MKDSYSAVLESVAVGDLDRTGRLEVVATDLAGYIYVFEASPTFCAGIGRTAPCLKPGFPVHLNYSFSRQGVPGFFNRDQQNRVQFGFLAAPGLADLDGNGKLEIVAGAEDRHLYAFQPDGSLRAGFPVILQDPAYVTSIDPGTDRIRYNTGLPLRHQDRFKSLLRAPRPSQPPDATDRAGSQRGVHGDPGRRPQRLGRLIQPRLRRTQLGRRLLLRQQPRVRRLQRRHRTRCPGLQRDPRPWRAHQCFRLRLAGQGCQVRPRVAADSGLGCRHRPAIAPASAVSCPGDATLGDRVAVFSSDGPPYIFAADGKSCYGQSVNSSGNPADRVLGASTENGNSTDTRLTWRLSAPPPSGTSRARATRSCWPQPLVSSAPPTSC